MNVHACMHACTHARPTWQQDPQQRPWLEKKCSLNSGQPVPKGAILEHVSVDAYTCKHGSMTRVYACMHAHTHACLQARRHGDGEMVSETGTPSLAASSSSGAASSWGALGARSVGPFGHGPVGQTFGQRLRGQELEESSLGRHPVQIVRGTTAQSIAAGVGASGEDPRR